MSTEISPPPLVMEPSQGTTLPDMKVPPTDTTPTERRAITSMYKKGVRLPNPVQDVVKCSNQFNVLTISRHSRYDSSYLLERLC
jgi:hypothetical protein